MPSEGTTAHGLATATAVDAWAAGAEAGMETGAEAGNAVVFSVILAKMLALPLEECQKGSSTVVVQRFVKRAVRF